MGKTTKKKTPKRSRDEVDEEVYIPRGTPLMTGYDDCICGVVGRFGQDSIVCYDLNKVLRKLQKQGMTREEAVEFFEFNQIGAWVGELTPCFLTPCHRDNLIVMDGED